MAAENRVLDLTEVTFQLCDLDADGCKKAPATT
jgi:hypothetical protein